jgi:hypothetical protein
MRRSSYEHQAEKFPGSPPRIKLAGVVPVKIVEAVADCPLMYTVLDPFATDKATWYHVPVLKVNEGKFRPALLS